MVESAKSASAVRTLAKQLSQEPESRPGTRESYSNIGFIVAGAALERIAGRSWEDLLQEHLFTPLGITTGGFGAPGTPGKIINRGGMRVTGNRSTPAGAVPTSHGMPARLVRSTMNVADWATFVSLHLRGNPFNPNRRVDLLNHKSFEDLHQRPARTCQE